MNGPKSIGIHWINAGGAVIAPSTASGSVAIDIAEESGFEEQRISKDEEAIHHFADDGVAADILLSAATIAPDRHCARLVCRN